MLTPEQDKPLTTEQVREIAEIADRATPGPWKTVKTAHSMTIQTLPVDARRNGLFEVRYWMGEKKAEFNAEFVENSRTDVPALCRTVEALRQERDADKARLDWLDHNDLFCDIGGDHEHKPGCVEQRGNGALMQLQKSDEYGLYWKRVPLRAAIDAAMAARPEGEKG